MALLAFPRTPGDTSGRESSPPGRPADRPPYLTVVTIFHDRLQFLPEAIGSVLAQVPDETVEVIVVGPDRPESISAWVEGGSVRFVPCAEQSLGAKVSSGIDAAHGEVIAFLEDDDTFAPSKVAALLREFALNPRLGYFQNGFDLIDARGESYRGRYVRRPAMRRWDRLGRIGIPAGARPRELRVLALIPSGHSLSSIAVRRTLVAGQVGLIRQVGYAIDNSLFAIALVARNIDLVFDPTPLSHLRVHDTLSNPQKPETLTVLTQLAWDGRHALLRFVNSSGSPDLARVWQGLTAASDFIHFLKTGTTSRRTFAETLLASLARWDTFGVQSRWPFVALGALSTLSPKLGRATYLALRDASAAVDAPLRARP